MSNEALTQKPEWKALKAHLEANHNVHIPTLFRSDLGREKSFKLKCEDVSYDFSKTHLTEESIEKLCSLAVACNLKEERERLFSGFPVNTTENRAALHMACRGSCDKTVLVDGKNANEEADKIHAKMKAYTNYIHNSQAITDIVSIGIGGSYIGPRSVCEALQHLSVENKKVHFISNIDPVPLAKLFATLNPQRTVFLVASKTFTTLEALSNAEAAKQWMIEGVGEDKWSKYFCALTGNTQAAQEFGIQEKYIFNIPNWVGGRFSLWSSIGLPICLAVGYEYFQKLLDGAHKADKHFLMEPFNTNIPVMMALTGIWYRNFWKTPVHCVLPYSNALQHFPQYVQQLDMESNGKTTDRQGNPVDYETAPISYGGIGQNAQHAFFQQLHQGTTQSLCDFIVIRNTHAPIEKHQDKLVASALGQTKALAYGQENKEEPHKNFPGNRPSNMIWLSELTPENLGMLMAFYEHKTFVQGVIWNINSFDQWGVQLGKDLAQEALSRISR